MIKRYNSTTDYGTDGLTSNVKKQLQTKRKTSYSSSSKIKKRVLSELNNPEVVYHLGQQPVYIHSREAYFRAGLKTATREMSILLSDLVDKQKKTIQTKINLIDTEWTNKLQHAFKDEITNFTEFKRFWDNCINNQQNPSEFANRLFYLVQLKDARVKQSALNQIRDNALKSVQKQYGKTPSIQGAQALQELLRMFNMQVSIAPSGKTYQYTGEGKKLEQFWNKCITESTKQVLSSMNDAKIAGIYDLLTQAQIAAIKNGKTDINIPHTQIGKLLEWQSVGIYKNIVDNPLLDDKIIPLVANMVVTNVSAEENSGNSIIEKADTKFQFIDSMSGEIILEFLTSDKASESITYNKKIDINSKNIEQFNASLATSTLDFSNYKLSIPSFESNKEHINAFINYVMSNAKAFVNIVSVKEFKELIVLYAAWMKICVEIVGDTNISNTPIAIRTMRTIYNTADVLRLFVNLNTRDMLKYLNKSQIENSFYKAAIPFLNSTKDGIFMRKKLVLNRLGAKVNYDTLKNDSVLYSYLQSISGEIEKPVLETSFNIKLSNIMKGV